MAKKKRDAAYFRARLKRDHPPIFKALVDGRFSSVRKAAAAAGLIRLPTRVDALKREWRKANASERGAFDRWRAGLTAAVAPASRTADPTGKLTRDAAKFLSDWTKSRGITPGKIMQELGFSNFDFRLAQAMKGGLPLKDDVLRMLDPWMRKSGFR